MAKAKIKHNDNLAQKYLILLGKPLYFTLIGVLIGVAYILSTVGKITRKIFALSLPKIKYSKITTFFKLESLRINLFELNLLSKFKNFVYKIFSSLSKRKSKLQFKFLAPILILILSVSSFYFFILRQLPSPKELESRSQELSTKIYDRNGNLLYKIYKNENRTLVSLTDIPLHVRLAALAAEDAEFYNHPGFSLKGMFRAALEDVKSGSLQGGSTITQQLVKNTLLSPEKTITRKIKELVLSLEVESEYTKDQILEMYLNEVSYGGTAYGIQEASESYFGKDVKNISLGEAAFLAGLPKSPTLYSPFGQNPDLAFSRQKEVLHLMTVNKYITKEQETEAGGEKITFAPSRTQIKAPHFVMYVRQLLVDKYGEDMVEKGGLTVTTSLDLDIQTAAERIVKDEINKLSNLHVGNGAVLVTNPQTGEILAMVGSKDYFDTRQGGNVNVLTRLRQPGSSIKLINYAYALAHGYTNATIIDDSPITYVTPGSPPYTPQNYDGQFRGRITLRDALAQSRNIPAVKVLASYGVSKMVEQGQKMGISTWTDSSNYGLSLTLGGGAIKGVDLAEAYSIVANYGKKQNLLPIIEVKDYKGKTLEKNIPALGEQILDPRIAYSLIDVLKDNSARAPEFGFYSSLVVKDHPEVAVKTGTSNDLRDNWTVGFNQNYLVLAWVGNNDNSPMGRIASGITGAAPIWNQVMSAVLNEKPSIDWKIPENMSKVNICSITGTLPCDSCPTRQEWFLDEEKPARHCSQEQLQGIISPTSVPTQNKILENGASTVNY